MLDNKNIQNDAILSYSIVQQMIHVPNQSIVSLLIAKIHVRKKLNAH